MLPAAIFILIYLETGVAPVKSTLKTPSTVADAPVVPEITPVVASILNPVCVVKAALSVATAVEPVLAVYSITEAAVVSAGAGISVIRKP